MSILKIGFSLHTSLLDKVDYLDFTQIAISPSLSLPGFLEASHASEASLSPEPMNPEPALLLDMETPSETSGINIVVGSQVFPDVLYLMENLDTKETDIIEFNNEQTEDSPSGMPESSRT